MTRSAPSSDKYDHDTPEETGMPTNTSETETVRGLDLATLTPWMQEWVDGGLAGPLTAQLVAGGRSNPTYVLADGSRDWILRRQPFGHVPKGAHDMAREHRVISALGRSAVPVPATVGVCDDSNVLDVPFYVMDRLDGHTLRTQDETRALSEAQRSGVTESLLDTLVALHDVDPADVGLADWGRPEGYLERQVARWARQWDAVKTVERPEFDTLIARLKRALPATTHPGITHGDYKIDNVMVDRQDPTRIIGVLDWEMSTLGDTLADLGLLVSFWDEEGGLENPITAGATALPGFPTQDEIVESYARRRGIGIDGIDWYVVLADLKVAVVVEQIHARHLRGETLGDWYDDLGPMVPALLGRALTRADDSSNRLLRAVGS